MEIKNTGATYPPNISGNAVKNGIAERKNVKVTKQSENNTVIVNNEKSVVYEKRHCDDDYWYNVDVRKLNKMIEETNQKTQGLVSLVEKLLKKQGLAYEAAISTFSDDKEIIIPLDEETILQAKEDIGEDGYYGIKQTSERIITFAKSISGKDDSKMEMVKEAVIKGFEEAKKAWGGELPRLCQDTYEAVMQGLEA